MNVLISGYLPREGRFSMVRTARTIAAHAAPLLGTGDSIRLDERAGEPVVTALDYGSLTLKVRKRLLMPLHLRHQQCDVLHIIDSDYAAAIPAPRLAHALVTCHDTMPFLMADTLADVFPSRLGARFYRQSLKKMALAARVVCVSNFTRRCVLEYSEVSEGQSEVIAMGVDDAFQPVDMQAPAAQAFLERNSLTGKRVVLHVGNTEPYKNLETVFDVFARLRRHVREPMVLLKVGGKMSRPQQEHIARLKVGDSLVHLTGLGDEELVWAYNAADLLMWPSRFEGFGLPVLEAMACGTPVVCSNGGALPEVAGDAAVIHAPDDADGLAHACVHILEDEEHAETLRERGLRRAATFSWAETARQYLRVYRQLAAR